MWARLRSVISPQVITITRTTTMTCRTYKWPIALFGAVASTAVYKYQTTDDDNKYKKPIVKFIESTKKTFNPHRNYVIGEITKTYAMEKVNSDEHYREMFIVKLADKIKKQQKKLASSVAKLFEKTPGMNFECDIKHGERCGGFYSCFVCTYGISAFDIVDERLAKKEYAIEIYRELLKRYKSAVELETEHFNEFVKLAHLIKDFPAHFRELKTREFNNDNYNKPKHIEQYFKDETDRLKKRLDSHNVTLNSIQNKLTEVINKQKKKEQMEACVEILLDDE